MRTWEEIRQTAFGRWAAQQSREFLEEYLIQCVLTSKGGHAWECIEKIAGDDEIDRRTIDIVIDFLHRRTDV